MKLLTRDGCTKLCIYFGIQIALPHNARWIATEADGNVYTYVSKPKASAQQWVRDDHANFSTVTKVAYVDLEGLDWRDTLQQV